MARKFFDGLIFGFGFSLALLVVGGLAMYLLAPPEFRPVQPSVSFSQGELPPTQFQKDLESKGPGSRFPAREAEVLHGEQAP